MSPCIHTLTLPIKANWKHSMSACIRALCLFLAACAVLPGQRDATPPPTKGFTVAILQGDGLANPLARPPASHLSIRVNDIKGVPIRNAVAVFELPAEGASATFPDGSMVKVILTNDKGEAKVDIKSNEVPGKYQPTIMVNYPGVAIATIVTIFAAHRGQSSTTPLSTSGITITPGTGTVGAH
jgi:hypothetical protein